MFSILTVAKKELQVQVANSQDVDTNDPQTMGFAIKIWMGKIAVLTTDLSDEGRMYLKNAKALSSWYARNWDSLAKFKVQNRNKGKLLITD